MFKKARAIGFGVSLFLIVVGGFGFFSGLLVCSHIIEYRGELPLSDVVGIVVDKSKNIYVGLYYYLSVQQYDSNGLFIRNWSVVHISKTFKMNLSKDKQLMVSRSDGKFSEIYDDKGNIITKGNFENYLQLKETDKRSFKSNDGAIYNISGYIFPKIIGYPNGKIYVNQNLFLRILSSPLSFLILTSGLILAGRVGKKFKK